MTNYYSCALAEVKNDEERRRILTLMGATGVKGVFGLSDELLCKIDDILAQVTEINAIARDYGVVCVMPSVGLCSNMVILFERQMSEENFELWLNFWSALIGDIKIKGYSPQALGWRYHNFAASIQNKIANFRVSFEQDVADFLTTKLGEVVVHGKG